MWRINGPFFGLFAFILDVLKVYIAFLILKKMGVQESYLLLSTSLCVIGHMYPCFNLYQGGKGIACFVAILSLFFPKVLMLFIIVWSALKFITSDVGIASIVSVLISCTYIYIEKVAYSMFIGNMVLFIITMLTIVKHRNNIISF